MLREIKQQEVDYNKRCHIIIVNETPDPLQHNLELHGYKIFVSI